MIVECHRRDNADPLQRVTDAALMPPKPADRANGLREGLGLGHRAQNIRDRLGDAAQQRHLRRLKTHRGPIFKGGETGDGDGVDAAGRHAGRRKKVL